ncbi:hypothetical protein kac65v162_gp103 [Nodularia phage vB_NspS-kac65v162]|uniref:Uncharacterized protein n=6 Tax=Ravarandavirus TaxID=2843444 RepID=A0A482MIX7_9CAUD|nr:hypothetical protein HWA92_gp087 [Nodularia phage vB_NpeS-2AV2]YP_009844706.1 hypothetical protein HWC12_gp103 [Nodularia phage vB_NspS-kac65v151]YP_009844914.1 hypothetical protein HWC13_gp105 [Nodularia phage vB_NspS-kac68v161]QBQ73341.1 hypothetical protein kac65v161_gp103 [Nodularia phage vB_NspS-kac65v161]QBQ73547.1 hypothetical protein kac65v162_gp103 [Nodularia phage vB_NspS-kac65v162]QBQ73951.1 hypothetical protein kac68v162_gp103 [Nodularia phage vB_NspS-kac68v162]ALY07539.1 hypot
MRFTAFTFAKSATNIPRIGVMKIGKLQERVTLAIGKVMDGIR